MMKSRKYFVHHACGNFDSVSISDTTSPKPGPTPSSQLAFTLANGFTYVESYLARGCTSTISRRTELFLQQRH